MFTSYRIHGIVISSQPEAEGDTLESLRAQDYSNLEISVVHSWGNYSSAANQAVQATVSQAAASPASVSAPTSEDADFLLFVTDDVVLEPNLLSEMVMEAERSNAGVVGAKSMTKYDPRRIAEMGIGIDKIGGAVNYVSPGELDQGQYDTVPSPAFAVSQDCMLVRRDLFMSLQGFDEAIPNYGSNLDFCWRAHLAGAVVMIAPSAVSKLQTSKAIVDEFAFSKYRHQIRMFLACYSIPHQIRVLPQALLVAFLALVWSLVTLNPRRVMHITAAWAVNIFGTFSIVRKRRIIAESRVRPDIYIRALQEKGFAPFILFMRDSVSPFSGFRKFLVGKGAWFAWVGILGVFWFGSRHLFTQSLPVLGELLNFDVDFFGEWSTSWRSNGLGADRFPPGAALWLGLLNVVFFGYEDLARSVFLLSPFILGGIGIWHLLGQIAESPRAKAAAAIAYLAIPLPYNALGSGDLDALILYASAPAILALLLTRRNFFSQSLILGLILGFAASFSLDVLGLLLLLMAGCVLAGFLSGALNFRSLAVGAFGGVVGGLLNLSWGVEFWEWRPSSLGTYSLLELMVFDVGGVRLNYLIWGFVGTAAVLVLIAKKQRSVWMTYAWVFYLGGIALAWAGEQGFHQIANVEVLLVPAALGLAMALGMGIEIFEVDIDKISFSWSRVFLVFGAVAFVVGTIPVLVLSLDGRWDLPKNDYQATLKTLESSSQRLTSQRIVWIGHPEILGTGSWELGDSGGRLAFSVTLGTTPSIVEKWGRPQDAATQLLEDELRGIYGENRLGGKLALFGVSHIILLEQLSPESQPLSLSPEYESTIPIDEAFIAQFEEQIDLREIEARNGIRIYENTEVIPVRAAAPPLVLSGQVLDPSLTSQVFQNSSTEEFSNEDFYFGENASGWRLKVNGEKIEPIPTFGWAKLYPEIQGNAVLKYQTSTSHKLYLFLQVIVWAIFVFGTTWVVRHVKIRASRLKAGE